MKIFNRFKNTTALLSILLACCMGACSEEEMNKPLQSVDILSKITLKVTDPLPLLIHTDTMIAYEVAPSDATNTDVIWRSTDTDIATVDEEGRVTARKTGKVQIIVSPKVGFATTAQFTLEVIDHIVSIESLNFEQGLELYTTASLALVEKMTFTPENVTYKTLKWESLTPEIATVDENGMVVGLAKGIARIKVSALDGSGYSTIVVVKVIKAVEVTDITFDDAQKELALNETSQLNVSVNEGATVSTIEWSSSNPKVVEINSKGIITCKAIGSAILTAKTSKLEKNFEVSVVEGKINDTFVYENCNWGKGNAGTVEVADGRLKITGVTDKKPGTYKMQILRNGITTFKPSVYPIVAVKFEIPGTHSKFNGNLWNARTGYPDYGRYNNAGYLDFAAGSGKNSSIQVCYMNLSQDGKGFGGSKQQLTDGASVDRFAFEGWEMAYAEGSENPGTVFLHWVKTFKSVDELENYLETEKQ